MALFQGSEIDILTLDRHMALAHKLEILERLEPLVVFLGQIETNHFMLARSSQMSAILKVRLALPASSRQP